MHTITCKHEGHGWMGKKFIGRERLEKPKLYYVDTVTWIWIVPPEAHVWRLGPQLMVVWKVAEPSESGASLEGISIVGTQFPVYSCFTKEAWSPSCSLLPPWSFQPPFLPLHDVRNLQIQSNCEPKYALCPFNAFCQIVWPSNENSSCCICLLSSCIGPETTRNL